LIDLGLLAGQLNDSDTRRQQKREYQPTRFSPLSGARVFLRRNAWPVRKQAASAGAQDDVPAAVSNRT